MTIRDKIRKYKKQIPENYPVKPGHLLTALNDVPGTEIKKGRDYIVMDIEKGESVTVTVRQLGYTRLTYDVDMSNFRLGV